MHAGPGALEFSPPRLVVLTPATARASLAFRSNPEWLPLHLEKLMTKKFSLDEANRMLPLVSRIVRDIIDQYREWQRTVEAFEIAATLSRSEKPTPEAEALQHKAQELARDIQGFVGELSALGLEFKGFELGLVDFPADVEGRPIFWCWKHGEAAVTHWHDVDAGFNGRQPVESLLAPAHQA